jgi:pantoate--beta-alanine ligase
MPAETDLTPTADEDPTGPSGRPIVAHTRAELTAARAAALASRATRDATTAVVMTMGALHEGHRELLDVARKHAGVVILTVFVNPLQFAPGEDFERYPRTLDADLAVAADAGVDVVFAPSVADMYPHGAPSVTVDPGSLGDLLEGAFRPGFFGGVLTVVSKLLHLTQPDVAYFGEKDAQQLALVRRMVADLDMPVEIVGVPTVRDADGLARSSRNRYLSDAERRTALALNEALRAGVERAADGPKAVRHAAKERLVEAKCAKPPLRVDYLALVDADEFTDVPEDYAGAAVLAVAARVGETRLIDNMPVLLPAAHGTHHGTQGE